MNASQELSDRLPPKTASPPETGRLGMIIDNKKSSESFVRDNSALAALEQGNKGTYAHYIEERIAQGRRLLEERREEWKNYWYCLIKNTLILC